MTHRALSQLGEIVSQKVLVRGSHVLLFSHSVVSSSLQLRGLQHARLPILHCLPEFAQIHVH